jgi:hypothetical protein
VAAKVDGVVRVDRVAVRAVAVAKNKVAVSPVRHIKERVADPRVEGDPFRLRRIPMTDQSVRASRRRTNSFSVRRFVQNYSLSLVLACLFVASWLSQFLTGWKQFASEQQQHGQVPSVFGDDGYVWHFLADTFQNWQSEFLQLTVFVVLSVWLIHRDSPESRDSNDRMERKIDEIRRAVEQANKQGAK